MLKVKEGRAEELSRKGILQYKIRACSSLWEKRLKEEHQTFLEGFWKLAPQCFCSYYVNKTYSHGTSPCLEIGKCNLYSWRLCALLQFRGSITVEKDGTLPKKAFDKSRNKEFHELIHRRGLFQASAHVSNSLILTKALQPFGGWGSFSFKMLKLSSCAIYADVEKGLVF